MLKRIFLKRFLSYALAALFLLMFSSAADAQRKKKRLQRADELFEAGEYYKAAEKYKKLYRKVKNRQHKAEMCFKAGQASRFINEIKDAERWYKRAIRYDYPNPDVYLFCADMMKIDEDYEDAREKYNEYLELVPDDKRGQLGLASLDSIEVWKERPTRFIISEMEDVNSRESDFSPAYGRSNYSVLYFTSTRDGATGDKFSDAAGMNFADIFYTKQDNKGEWSQPLPLPGDVNTMYDEGTPCLNKNKITLYFTRCVNEKGANLGCKIYSASKSGSQWTNVKEEEVVKDSSISVAHPAISDDELTMYFVSDDLEGGLGGNDIWVVTREKRSAEWGEPVNLGEPVNTPMDEMFPFLRNDTALYYASNYQLGMGGLDIYRAKKNENGQWVTENMYPLNSFADDFGIVWQPDYDEGVFSTTREGRRNSDELFQVKLPPLEFKLEGWVHNEKTNDLIEGAKVKLIGSDGTSLERISASNGAFRFELDPKTDYLVMTSKEGFLNGKGQETTKGLRENTTLEMHIYMAPIEQTFELPNIEYDYGEATLRPVSMISLDKLVEILNDNPDIRIELMAHTDFRGSDESNLDLSQRRAQSVVDYLISKGIKSRRLEPKGYGETKPKEVAKETAQKYNYLNEGDVLTEEFIKKLKTEEQKEVAHQLNRRTEFRVIEQ